MTEERMHERLKKLIEKWKADEDKSQRDATALEQKAEIYRAEERQLRAYRQELEDAMKEPKPNAVYLGLEK